VNFVVNNDDEMSDIVLPKRMESLKFSFSTLDPSHVKARLKSAMIDKRPDPRQIQSSEAQQSQKMSNTGITEEKRSEKDTTLLN
jgi:hypothetical protein